MSVAVSNLLLLMLLYSVSRLFFFAVNSDLFPLAQGAHLFEMLAGGFRFDLTAVLYLSSAYLIMMLLPLRLRSDKRWETAAKWLFLVPNIIGLAVNTADMVYFRYTDRRTTCRIFTEFSNDGNLLQIIGQGAVQYWYVTLFGAVAIAALCMLYRKETATDDGRRPWVYYTTETVLFAASIYLIVIGIRGGFGRYTRPITISNALQYTAQPQETGIVLNTPFSLMKSLENTTYTDPRYFSAEELPEIFNPEHQGTGAAMTEEPCNVVVFILESFSKEYFGYYNRDLDEGSYTGYTPFLDSLLEHSVSYPLSLASGRKSIDAMPSVLSGIPMLIEPYIVTPYSTNRVSSVAGCLREKGYSTAFFHGAPNGSMGFQAYARSAGFEEYYGMDEYDGPEAFDGTWAIWDEEFLQYFARKMSDMRRPFCTAVFTASSHHPFKVPERYEGLLPEGTHPIHRCIAYTDHALRLFFEKARQTDWYDNTLFVFTADHTNHLTHEEYLTPKGVYEVPVFFYKAGGMPSVSGQTHPVSQTDIMPSVLAYLGYDETYVAFGEDVLTREKETPYAVNYNHPLYQVFSDSLLLQYDGTETTGIYNFQEDRLMRENRVEEYCESEEAKAMEKYLKAFIQQYIERMIDDRLTTK